MKILGIDTSAQTASTCVCEDGKIIISSSLNTGLTHSQTLLPMIESMLLSAKMSLSDIDVFAVSNGPGSFTGIRIGVSAIKGFAFAENKLCIGVSTLKALAYNMDGFDGIICPCMDARRNQVYNALFENNERITNDRAISVEELREDLLKYQDKNIWLVGDGAELVYNKLKDEIKKIKLAPITLRLQLASSVCMCAQSEKQVSPNELLPSYLRLSQAERERAEKLNEN